MSSYQIKPFSNYSKLNESYLYFDSKLIKIENYSVYSLIDSLQNETFIKENELINLINKYNLDLSEVKNYLIHEIGILEPYNLNPSCKIIYLFSDDTVFLHLITRHLRKNFNINIKVISEDNEITEVNSITIVYLSNYQSSQIKKIQKRINELNLSILITSYLFNDTIYVDNIYQKEGGYPCHFCNMGEILGDASLMLTNHQDSFYLLHKFIFEKNININLSKEITELEISILIKHLIIKITPFFNKSAKDFLLSESLHLSSVIDPKSMHIRSDTPLHWNLCNCLSGGDKYE